MSKLKEFKNIFICNYCNEKLKDPIIIPCEESICRHHESELTSKSCPICDATHVEPPNGFLSNRALKEMIKIGADKIDVNFKVLNDCKKSIDQLNISAMLVNSTREDPSSFIYNHFSEFKREVDLRYEQLKCDLDKCYKNLINKIEISEKKSHDHTEKNFVGKIKDSVEEYNAELKILEKKLNSFEINELLFENIIQESKVLKANYDKTLSYYEGLILNNEEYKFEFKKIQLAEYMGTLKVQTKEQIENKTLQVKITKPPKNFMNPFPQGILNDQTAFDLMNLCEYSGTQKWQLVYKASQDGFEAKDFHKKCDNVSKTLTVIKTKTGYVFGGYTSQKWGQNEEYIDDPECFIFSLINKKGTPSIINKSIDKIFNSPKKGPIFGRSNHGHHNIFIMSGSNKSWRNYFYMDNFKAETLSGTDFYIEEIEVYSKL